MATDPSRLAVNLYVYEAKLLHAPLALMGKDDITSPVD